jgi:shikimate kinase
MATGKTTTGKILAERIGYYFIDIDDEIERVEGLNIETIFEKKGEPYFRQIEKKITIKLSKLTKHVIACGGGVVLNPKNVDALRKSSKLVLLTTTKKETLRRIEHDFTRPLLNVNNRISRIELILNKRLPIYKRIADIEVETTELSPDEVAESIIEQLSEELKC